MGNMKLIYSKLPSGNVMNGRLKDGATFSVYFKSDKKTPLKDEEYDALMGEEDSALSFLIAQGEFVVDGETTSNEISGLKGEITKLQNALKIAEEQVAKADKEKDALAVEKAEMTLLEAEDAFESCEDASQKKELKKIVDKAKKALNAAKKA